MLKKEKISFFKDYLEKNNESYSDIMKDELYIFFFENENNLDFLDALSSQNEIINKVDTLVYQMIMHEDEDELFNIIEIYV